MQKSSILAFISYGVTTVVKLQRGPIVLPELSDWPIPPNNNDKTTNIPQVWWSGPYIFIPPEDIVDTLGTSNEPRCSRCKSLTTQTWRNAWCVLFDFVVKIRKCKYNYTLFGLTFNRISQLSHLKTCAVNWKRPRLDIFSDPSSILLSSPLCKKAGIPFYP